MLTPLLIFIQAKALRRFRRSVMQMQLTSFLLFSRPAVKWSWFSAPGRTEIGGNHTDHQHGRVLAAGVNLDVIAVASKNDENVIRIKSEGYPMDTIDLSVLEPVEEENNHAAALIRGVAARMKMLGYDIGGV